MPPRGLGGGRDLLLVVVVALWCSALRCAVTDLAADRAALLAFRAAVGPRLPWDASAASPCGWRGVRCDPGGGRVVALRLPASGLSGRVPPGTVGNLTALRALSLRANALSGWIPADIGNCGGLRYLYLQGNQIAGEIPEGFFSLHLLQRLDLSHNRIPGGVSPEFNKLRRLATLYLQNNRLNGTLPGDLDLPKLQLFNVSYNDQLTGPVPSSLAGRTANAFVGTGLCGAPLTPCANPTPAAPSPTLPPPPPGAQETKKSKLSGGAIAGIAAGAVVAFLVVLAVIFLLCFQCTKTKVDRSEEMAADADGDTSPVTVTVARTDRSDTKRSRSSHTMASDARKLVFVGGAPDVPYDLDALLHGSAEVLGKGWLGTTYRATLEGRATVVAVKRLREVPIPEREFRDKLAALGALRHENLAPLRAYFYSREEKFVVYDFVGAGGLSSLLHGTNGVARARLNFTARARIALAAAHGVACIHGAGAGSSHGNIKSSNILVTDEHDGAYVTDHGIVQLVGATVPLKRVTGYRAPEVTDARKSTHDADVYSFGVLLLELLTGRPPTNALPGHSDGIDLPQWVRTMVQEEWTAEVFDASIANEAHVKEMMRLLQLATDCTEQRPERRPAMAEVAARIEHIVDSTLRKADTDDFQSVSASA